MVCPKSISWALSIELKRDPIQPVLLSGLLSSQHMTYLTLVFAPSGHLYFTDSELRAIKRVKFSNENASQAPDNLGLDNVYRPMGIAVDWLGK